MDEITLRLVYTAAGFGFGLVMGWTSRAARDARAVRKVVMDNGETTAGEHRRWRIRKITRTDIVMLLLIAVTLTATLTSWRTDARVDRMATCTVAEFIEQQRAVEERTTYTEESARRNTELQQAQRAMLTVMLDQKSTRPARLAALERYAAALDAFQDVQAKAAATRKRYPYPTPEQVERCR